MKFLLVSAVLSVFNAGKIGFAFTVSNESFDGNRIHKLDERLTFVLTPMNWFAAREYCERMGRDLATMKTPDESETFLRAYVGHGYAFEGWLGYSNLGDKGDHYVWTSWPPEKSDVNSYKRWELENREPLDITNRNCVVTKGRLAQWFTAKCDEEHEFACEKSKYFS